MSDALSSEPLVTGLAEDHYILVQHPRPLRCHLANKLIEYLTAYLHEVTFRNTFDVVALYGLVQSPSYDSDRIGMGKYPNHLRNKPTETLRVMVKIIANQNWEVARHESGLLTRENCSGGA